MSHPSGENVEYPAIPGYPQQPGNPPNSTAGGYPSAGGAPGYPPTGSGYPPASSGYPPVGPGYPPVGPGYPPSGNSPGYPPVGPGYPPAGSGYPPVGPGFPPAGGSAGYPPVGPGFHPAGGAPFYPQAKGVQGYGQPGITPGGGQSDSTQGYGQPGQVHHDAVSYYINEDATLKPATFFNAENDVLSLKKAMQGFGNDKKEIIDIIANRSSSQRQHIKTVFKVRYGQDLLQQLKNELGGYFEECLIGLMKTTDEYDASKLNRVKRNDTCMLERCLDEGNKPLTKDICCINELVKDMEDNLSAYLCRVSSSSPTWTVSSET